MSAKIIFGIIALGIIFLLCLFAIFQSQAIKKTYRREVEKGLIRLREIDSSVITENDLEHLPPAVKKYLHYSGVVGKEKVKNVRMHAEGHFKIGKDKDWSVMNVDQHNYFDEIPSRLSYMKIKIFGLPIIGLDTYIDGKGSMLGKILGLITVINGIGKEMDHSEAAVFLSEMCTTPATLIDSRIQWEEIDDTTVRATLSERGNIVSGVLFFNEKGEFLKFTTKDKLYQEKDGSYSEVEWSMIIKEYEEMNGQKVGTSTEVVWHFLDGDFCYGKLRLMEFEVNG